MPDNSDTPNTPDTHDHLSHDDISPISIEAELKQSYLDYAMSVIVSRALPDVRDGLKPVHRRVLFAMKELGNDSNKPHKKSARVVGDVIGKYHPHGDGPVYGSVVRMAQPFSMRYVLVDGQGNFGSIDGDSPAAMRYTEVRMSHLAHELLRDLDKKTVNFHPNYDGSEQIPEVLPTRVPNLLVNGSSGIAVGMATNIPPHRLSEVIDACIQVIDNPEVSIDDLMQVLPGPDFPTKAIISGRAGIIQAYKTGRGRIYVKSRAEIEEKDGGREKIVITEIPYQVNKARLIEKIAELVKHKKIEGISELRDESDKDGLRIVIDVRRGENSEVLLNNLYSQTQLQVVFGINMVALVNNQPRTLNLKEVLNAFIKHRQEVVTRRTLFDLAKARARCHLLEGLGIALNNIDEVIVLIKAAQTSAQAKDALLQKKWKLGTVKQFLEKIDTDLDDIRPHDLPSIYGAVENEYRFSPQQVDAILDLKLHRLTGLEQNKIFDEYQEIIEKIKELLSILGSFEKLMQVIRDELIHIKETYKDERQTEITASQHDLTVEDLINEEEMVVTLSSTGYIKSQPLTDYQSQHRGGRGKRATSVKEEDYISNLLIANTHTNLLCFSSTGKVYWLKVYQLPQAGRNSRGRPINNLLQLDENENISAMLSVKSFDESESENISYIFMATRAGTVKKTPLEAFSRPRQGGIRAIELEGEDELIGVAITNGEQDIMMFSNSGKAIRFTESQVRAMGRTAKGVRGMRLKENQYIISLMIVNEDNAQILLATEKGYGKRTAVSDFRRIGRGGQGVQAIVTEGRNGQAVSASAISEKDEFMLITSGGVMVRTHASEVSCLSRYAQGVRLINLDKGSVLVCAEQIKEIVDDEDNKEDDTVNSDENNSESEDALSKYDQEEDKGDYKGDDKGDEDGDDDGNEGGDSRGEDA